MRETPVCTAADAIYKLAAGNLKYLNAENGSGDISRRIRMSTWAKGQSPYAIIVTCSDSRVIPENIFSAGIGELFVIRLAGNVLSPEVAGTMQYAGTHLKTPLFVVLGHEGCGAVKAALDVKFRGARDRSRIEELLQNILPALDGLDPELPEEELMRAAVEANVRWTIRRILATPEAQQREAEGILKLFGAVYDLATGAVRFLDP